MDKLKELFSGTKGKVMIGAIVLVVVIALYMRSKKAAQPSNEMVLPTYPTAKLPDGQTPSDTSSNQDIQNMVGSLYQDLGKQLEAQSENQQKTAEQFAASLSSTQTAFSQMFGALSTQVTAQYSNVNAAIQKDMLAHAEKEADTFNGFIYHDTHHEQTVQYEAYEPAPAYAHDDQTAYQKVFGVGAGDGNDPAIKKQWAANEARLKSDAGYRKSEVERAKAVIKNREAAGLDTSEQQKYLDRIAG